MLFDSFEAYDVQETRRISKEEGVALGKAKGKAESILEILRALGNVPEDLENRILKETNLALLKKWLLLAVHAGTLQEFQSKAGI